MGINNEVGGAVDVQADAYLAELAEDICANGGLAKGQTLADALARAHGRRKAFALEMSEGRTDWAKKARRILTAKVHGDLLLRLAFSRIEQEEIDAGRMRFLRDGRAALANVGSAP